MGQSSEAQWSHTFSPASREQGEKTPGVYCLFCSVAFSSFHLILILQTALALIQYCLLALRREQLVKRLLDSSSFAPGVFPKKDRLNSLVFNS